MENNENYYKEFTLLDYSDNLFFHQYTVIKEAFNLTYCLYDLRMSQIKNSDRSFVVAASTNAEYAYIIEDQDVWFIDYIIGIAFKTPVDYSTSKKVHDDNTTNTHTNGLLESGRPYREFYDIKDFQDYMEDKTCQEIVIESSVDPLTNMEKDDRRIIWHVSIN
jgi:hypothetical protein